MNATGVILDGMRKPLEQAALLVMVILPFVAVILAVPIAWGMGISWDVLALGVVFYTPSMLGITVGFHRLFAHRSFRPSRGLKIGLAIAGSFAIQGPVVRWVADH